MSPYPHLCLLSRAHTCDLDTIHSNSLPPTPSARLLTAILPFPFQRARCPPILPHHTPRSTCVHPQSVTFFYAYSYTHATHAPSRAPSLSFCLSLPIPHTPIPLFPPPNLHHTSSALPRHHQLRVHAPPPALLLCIVPCLRYVVITCIRDAETRSHTEYVIEVALTRSADDRSAEEDGRYRGSLGGRPLAQQGDVVRNWTTRRRYRQFWKLHEALRKLGFPGPVLPPKRIWGRRADR